MMSPPKIRTHVPWTALFSHKIIESFSVKVIVGSLNKKKASVRSFTKYYENYREM